ncbi:F-box/kelch-repeat protein At1g74510-like isoform X2 [Cornus florida]|uniref:F-box/kelch-repeat protein At1g74510-like isoform X2 n=1 Tax=Cornus florida TaxID=4283 RepID=UPI00289968A3|nr:F-box/kelch-repeat protein At1g74510-like isoform X2 [Cornus florida]
MPEDNSWHDFPKMQCEHRNPIAAAAAIVDKFLYLAGGYEGNPTQRFNLSTGEWQALPSMQKARAFATGIAHKGKFYVFGGATPKHSAEIYDPPSNTWLSIDSFVPEEADGYAVTSTFMNLVILTWSDPLGVKLWLRVEKSNEALENGTWTIVSDFPNNEEVDRLRFRHHGAKMVKLGNEVCVLMGKTDCVWRVGGPVAWPISISKFLSWRWA